MSESTALEPGAAQDPTLCFPDELLGEIFLQLLDLRFNSRLPFVVAATCRRWRAVALHTPALWTSVKYTISKNVFPQNRWARCFNIHLERSRARLLHVHIFWRADCGLVPDLYNAILALLRRAQRFALATTRNLGAYAFLGDAPHLTDCWITRNSPQDVRPWELFLHAPRLTTFEYRGLRLHWTDAQTQFPLVTVLSLDVETFNANDFFAAVSRYFPHVEEFSLTVRDFLGGVASANFTAPHLRTFKLSLYGTLGDTAFMRNYNFPALRTASLYVGDYVLGDPISPFLHSCGRTVEVLGIGFRAFAPGPQRDAFLDAVSACANVRRLTLSVEIFQAVNADLLAALDQPGVFPGLETLVLMVSLPLGGELGEAVFTRLEAVAEARRPALKRIELFATEPEYDIDVQVLQQRLDIIVS